MVGVEGIAEWIGREVVDREGDKVGKLTDVYYDTADDQATFVSVKSGTFGRSHSVAPLTGATLSRDYVRLDATKEAIKDAPSEDAGGRLTGIDALRVLSHFGLPPEPDLEGEERVCFQTAGAAAETERKRAEVEATQAREGQERAAAAAAVPAAIDAPADEGPEPERDLPRQEPERDLPRQERREIDAAGRSPEVPAVPMRDVPEETARAVAANRPQTVDDDAPLARLAELERRVAALENRLT